MSRLRSSAAPAPGLAGLEDYLHWRFGCRAALVEVRELGQSTQARLKDFGYGRPLLVRFSLDQQEHRLVVRTVAPDPFGHERRGDRVGCLADCFELFATVPRHVRPFDVGTFTRDGRMLVMGDGEPFLVTEYVEGELYAHELAALQGQATAPERSVRRVRALAQYLAALHRTPAPAEAWRRCLRDTVGSGEGIFGLCDSYPAHHPVATASRLEGIERSAGHWRWRLRGLEAERSRRTHGDFHPFNILFREEVDFSVLDCSRGAAGEPADDVTALAINFAFFALAGGDPHAAFGGALRELWDVFWQHYLEVSGDEALLTVVAPFVAWRALVVASPLWYPSVHDAVRHRMLRFAERLLEGAVFAPDGIDALLEP